MAFIYFSAADHSTLIKTMTTITLKTSRHFLAAAFVTMLPFGTGIPTVQAEEATVTMPTFGTLTQGQINRFNRYGHNMALLMRSQYRTTVSECVGGTPAYVCSGIMLRALNGFSTQWHGWEPSPLADRDGTMSFSWLRRDTKFKGFAFGHESGYVLFPAQRHPAYLIDYTAHCYFPTDGATYERDDHGCGATTLLFPNDSRGCDQYGITTVDAWHQHYFAAEDRQHHQCAFMLNGDRDTARRTFQLALQAGASLGDTAFNDVNEFKLDAWPHGTNATLPVEAFFYEGGKDEGREHARNYQRDFYQQAHRFVPVIRLDMPTDSAHDVGFVYRAEDQGF